MKWGERKKKKVELIIDKRIEDQFTLKYGVLGINTKSIYNSAQYVTLESKIKCLSLAVFLLAIPPIQLKLELHIRGELLIANHLNQSLWSTNQKYWAAVRCNLLHSLWEVHNCVVPFTRHCKLHEFGVEKPISWAKPEHFDYFAMNYSVWSHILSTVGNALSHFTQYSDLWWMWVS